MKAKQMGDKVEEPLHARVSYIRVEHIRVVYVAGVMKYLLAGRCSGICSSFLTCFCIRYPEIMPPPLDPFPSI